MFLCKFGRNLSICLKDIVIYCVGITNFNNFNGLATLKIRSKSIKSTSRSDVFDCKFGQNPPLFRIASEKANSTFLMGW